MPVIVLPEADLFAILEDVWYSQRGTYITCDGVVYRRVTGTREVNVEGLGIVSADYTYYIEIPKSVEQTSFGSPTVHHRGFYPPEGLKDGN